MVEKKFSSSVVSKPWFTIIIIIAFFIIYSFFLKTSNSANNIELLFFMSWVIFGILFEVLKYRLLLSKYSENTALFLAGKQIEEQNQKEMAGKTWN